MKKRIALVALALCLLFTLGACQGDIQSFFNPPIEGSGNVVEHSTPLPENPRGYALRVTGLSVRNFGSLKIFVVADESLADSVAVKTDDNISEQIIVTVNDKTGEIVVDAARPRVNLSPSELTIAADVPVRALAIDGGWFIRYDCPSVTDCKAEINGAANGDFAFGFLDSLDVTVNGAGNLTMRGTAQTVNLELNGAANIKAFDLTARSASVTIDGAGSCEIAAAERLNAVINGMGDITYDGAPAVSQTIHGVGTVKQRAQ